MRAAVASTMNSFPSRFLMRSEETRSALVDLLVRVRLHLTGRSMASFSPAL